MEGMRSIQSKTSSDFVGEDVDTAFAKKYYVFEHTDGIMELCRRTEKFILSSKERLQQCLEKGICKQAIFEQQEHGERISEVVHTKVLPNLTCTCVVLLTQVKKDNAIFHGHPYFQGKSAWNDWVYINYDDESSIPAQILIFLHVRDNTLQNAIHLNSTTIDQQGLYSISYTLEQPLTDTPNHNKYSNFLAHQSSRLFYWSCVWF